MAIETEFAVKLNCERCVDDVTKALTEVNGVERFDISLASGRVVVTSKTPPSILQSALQATGRQVILRGSGTPNSAAVAILGNDHRVYGLSRFVTADEKTTLVDITASGLRPGLYQAIVHESGDIRNLNGPMGDKGRLGSVTVGQDGKVQKMLQPKLHVWELFGHGFSLSDKQSGIPAVFGVIARSAGAWENDKVVCSCSGKTLWQENQEINNNTPSNL